MEANQKYTMEPLSAFSDIEIAISYHISELEQKFDSSDLLHPGQSLDWMKILQRTLRLWKPKYMSNSLEPMPRTVVFLHLGIHIDEYGWKGTAKNELKQTVMNLVSLETARGLRASPKSLAVLPILLTPSAAIKQNSLDKFLQLYSHELEQFSKGITMTIAGTDYLVFAFIWTCIGDLPARKEMVGLSKSVVVSSPCPSCTTKLKDFALCAGCPENLAAFRTRKELEDVLRGNKGKVGTLDPTVRAVAAHIGIDRASETLKWPGSAIPFCAVPDLMHQEYLGAAMAQFQKMCVQFPAQKHFWVELSRIFHAYTLRNRLHVFTKFDNMQRFKGIKSYGMRIFTQASPYILDMVKSVNITDRFNDEYHFWCVRVRITSILTSHRILASEIKEVMSLISEILSWYARAHPEMVTLNVHLVHHMITYLQEFGPLRDHWCFVFEAGIGVLKTLYNNTNNTKVSWSVYRRALLIIGMELISQITGSHNQAPKRYSR